MSEDGLFPSSFTSKAPIPEHITVLQLKNNEPYWMLSADAGVQKQQPSKSLAPYDDNDSDLLDCGDMEDNYEINPTKSGKYLTTFDVPKCMHAAIVGPRGSSLRDLQDRTLTLIKVPRPGEGTAIKVTGSSERAVAAARTQLAMLVLARRERAPVSHFVSVRVRSPEIERNFAAFRSEALSGPPTRGLDASLFQKPEKLHLTIVTLVLLDEAEIGDAKAIFGRCRDLLFAWFQNPVRLTLKGVEAMNDDPSEVDVLYARVEVEDKDKNGAFQSLCNDIYDCFTKAGLVRKQYDDIKLHCTLMNSRYRKKDAESKGGRNARGKRESFDASYILEQYKNYYFGMVDFNELQLSVRFNSQEDGYYESLMSLKK